MDFASSSPFSYKTPPEGTKNIAVKNIVYKMQEMQEWDTYI